MMNSQTETKNAFDEFFIEILSPPKEKCPSPKKLLKLLRSGLAEKRQKKVAAHIAHCRSCAREIKYIHSMLQAEQTAEQDLAFTLKRTGGERIRAKNAFPSSLSRLSWSSRTSWIIVFCVVIAAVFFVFKERKPAVERNTTSSLALILPAEKSIPLSELIFQWEVIPETEYSILEIFDDSLKLVWRSDRVLLNRLEPVEELEEELKPGETYLWMVTSFLKSGKKLESRLAKFILKKPETESPR